MTNLKSVVLSALEELKAIDVTPLDVRKLTSLTDYMIITTGTSVRHIKSIADNVVKHAKQNSFEPFGIEGETGDTNWILIDLGTVVVHVMLETARDFYQLEKLWTVRSYRQAQHAVVA